MWLIESFQSAHAFLIGTKYDQFATLSVEEQEEITKQVLIIYEFNDEKGTKICQSNEGATYFLFYFPFNQCPKNLQNCLEQGFRSKMHN
jgi:hypothetical protein